MWHVLRNGQICPTDNEAQTMEEAIEAAKIFARYDNASYAVCQAIYNVTAVDDTVEVRRAHNNRLVSRETYAPGEGQRGGF